MDSAVLASLATSLEVLVETRDGSRRYRTVIWVAELDGSIYVRSYLGDRGRWYQRALSNPRVRLIVGDTSVPMRATPARDAQSIEAASQGFRDKYPASRSLDAMLRPEVLDTTLLLEAEETDD